MSPHWQPAFLVGFEKSRPFDGHTFRQGDVCWEKNLYRHPLRQGLLPEDDYQSGSDDDGVCVPGAMLDISPFQAERNERKKATLVKRTLIDLASSRLASWMGHKFTGIVPACLTCLDRTDKAFGHPDEFLDEDGIVVGVRYFEKVEPTTKGSYDPILALANTTLGCVGPA
ncbi:hypothetical protein AYO22_04673 [Fonsecaea multimorphosa]|nr:hypothetical protein AYO22_04673 [Fonsecaea multimorphosa]